PLSNTLSSTQTFRSFSREALSSNATLNLPGTYRMLSTFPAMGDRLTCTLKTDKKIETQVVPSDSVEIFTTFPSAGETTAVSSAGIDLFGSRKKNQTSSVKARNK